MINKLISLALILFFLTTGYAYSEDQFLFPKKKPSVFKKIEKNISSEAVEKLPQRKPTIQFENQNNKKIEKKKIETVEKKIVEKKVKKIIEKKVFFYYLKKNQ